MAFLAAAPEAEAAAGAAAGKVKAVAGKVKGKGKGDPRPNRPAGTFSRKAGQPRPITSDMSPEEVTAELEARKHDAANPPAPDEGGRSSSKPAAPLFVMPQADKWHTGSGLVLGAVGWVLFMNFMQGGMPQVRRWGAAKFLNRTPQVGGTK